MAKADKYYGGTLYARILILLKDSSGKSFSCKGVTKAVITDPQKTDFARVYRILRNMVDAGQIGRDLHPTPRKNLQYYRYYYVNV